MKHFARFMLVALMAFAISISTFAYDFEVDGIFYNTLSLEDLTCEVTYEKNENAYDYKSTYSGDLVVPSSVTYAGKTFKVTSIGSSAFERCSRLTSIVLPNSVTSIGNRAFWNCPGLTSIVLPNSVTRIYHSTFSNCTSLKEITSLNTTPPRIYEDTFENVSKPECLVKVPDEAVDAYKSADCWKVFWNIVGLDEEPGEEPELKCEEPTISLVGEKIVALSATKGSKCYTSITSDDFKGYDGIDPIDLCGVYKISSYAHADGYQNSETVTALLVWVNPELREDDSANIMQMDVRKAVVISINGNSLQISGTERGEAIQLYSIDGMLLESLSAEDGNTTIPYTLTKGDTYIIRYGDKTVKYRY